MREVHICLDYPSRVEAGSTAGDNLHFSQEKDNKSIKTLDHFTH